MCPMVKDADVIGDHPGKCPKCGMELKPVRIVQAFSCLNNTAFIQAGPGKCPTNGTDLVPITASMFWACKESPDKHELSPGKCSDGSERIQKFEPRLHGDHNPRHGGQLFMADDGWHHVEGAYILPGVFRVFFYDDWTRPIAPQGFEAHAVTKDAAGNETGTIPLRVATANDSMEAALTKTALPLSLSLRVRFASGEAEKLFDFTFKDFSKDATEPVKTTATAPESPVVPAPAAVVTPIPSTTAQQPTTLAPENIIPVGTFQMEPIPSSAREILAELKARDKDLSEKIEQRAPLGEYWVPALRTKDLALALVTDHLNEIPVARRAAAEDAVRRLTRVAYAIDNFGDLGDFDRIVSAHGEFASAVADLRNAYASIQ